MCPLCIHVSTEHRFGFVYTWKVAIRTSTCPNAHGSRKHDLTPIESKGAACTTQSINETWEGWFGCAGERGGGASAQGGQVE